MNRDEIRVGGRYRYYPMYWSSGQWQEDENVVVLAVLRRMVRIRMSDGQEVVVAPRNLLPARAYAAR